ncbi:Hypothetical Protein FCC1311_110382 [Hondaea fermentalgiana]|uniref:Uncharacterized protein n=1 Tax=Hondaea fermentalgiana TaxID=2315210 RepID=A0A2R5GVE3_9STRA|nr:Hypothetical Protein FCC1311_110382 [Hondaea fermentalgiana]|eukprot:GBG34816.1 Hypothetical Protein FCC1311_110382 [Hondaea fermentalgiana]
MVGRGADEDEDLAGTTAKGRRNRASRASVRGRLLGQTSEDEFAQVASYCDATTLAKLMTCNTAISALLRERDDIWAALYTTLPLSEELAAPCMHKKNSSWRGVVLRAIAGQIRVVVRPISHNSDATFDMVVPRTTTLFGLKKMVRRAQLLEHGVMMQDFELVLADSSLALGVRGHDALPPSDLTVLFLSSDSLLRSMHANESLRRLLHRNQRPAWRKTLRTVSDGIELVQVFVSPQGLLESPDLSQSIADASGSAPHDPLASSVPDPGPGITNFTVPSPVRLSRRRPRLACCDALKRLKAGELDELAEIVAGKLQKGSDKDDMHIDYDDRLEALERMCHLLDSAQRGIGYNAHKPFWNGGALHPLLHVSIATGTSMPLSLRRRALAEMVRLFLLHLVTKPFLVAAVARGILHSGFPCAFVRLVTSLVPLIVRTQVKQIMEGEIDWIPLVFATKFVARASLLVTRALTPIMGLALAHETLLSWVRTLYTEESERDDWLVYAALLLMFYKRTPPPRPASLDELSMPSRLEELAAASKAAHRSFWQRLGRLVQLALLRTFTLDDLAPYTRMTRRASLRLWLYAAKRLPRLASWLDHLQRALRHQVVVQYVLSSLLWNQLDASLSHATSVSLPVYAYSVPFVLSIMLVRIRMALSDSYYYLIYF